MLLELCVAALLCTIGLCVIAQLTQRVMRRLDVDPLVALLWLGLAERPIEPRRDGDRRGARHGELTRAR